MAFCVMIIDTGAANMVRLEQKKRLNFHRLDRIFKVTVGGRITVTRMISVCGDRSPLRRHADYAIRLREESSSL